jgi:hypothetical protein
MSEPKDQNEAACGGSALTAELGSLADQFECHALSRGIAEVEAAGRAMRAALAEIERLRIGNHRYETARRMNPRQWADAWKLNTSTGKPFDEIIDDMPNAQAQPTAKASEASCSGSAGAES